MLVNRWMQSVVVLLGLAVAGACCGSDRADGSSDDETRRAVLVESFVLQHDLISVRSDDRYTAPLAVDLNRIQKIARSRGARTMLVLRDRSLTDNSLSVFIGIRSEEGDSVTLADLSFFDPPNSTTDDSIMSSDQPLGFFFLDVTDEIDDLVNRVGGSDLYLEVTVSPIHGEVDRSKKFTIGRVSLDVMLLEK